MFEKRKNTNLTLKNKEITKFDKKSKKMKKKC